MWLPRYRLSILTTWLILQAGFARAADDLADLIERCEKSVIRVNVAAPEFEGCGSGFVVAPNTIVTNFHVVEKAEWADAEFSDGKSVRIKGYLALDPQRDVAILQIEEVDRPVLKLATVLPRKGERVLAIGAPEGLSFSSSDGIISAVRSGEAMEKAMPDETFPPDMNIIQTTAALSHGNSGGPLLNMAGEVLGINTFTRNDGQNLNFAVSAQDIKQVLNRRARMMSLPVPSDLGTNWRRLAPPPDSKHPRGAAPGPRRPGMITKLPSGKTLNIQEIFIAALQDPLSKLAHIPPPSKVDSANAHQTITDTYRNGKIAAVVSVWGEKLHGPLAASFETTGSPSTVANYSNGQLHGNLLTWDEDGRRVLFAQYLKGNEDGFTCFFKNDALWLVKEMKHGKPTACYLFYEGELRKTYAPDEPDKELDQAVHILDEVQAAIKKRERELKAKVAAIVHERRQREAAKHWVEARNDTAAERAKRDAADAAASQELIDFIQRARGLR